VAIVQSALMASYIALVCYGAWSDARTLRIPNTVSLAVLAAFIPMALMAGIGLEAIAWHLGAGVLVLVVGFALFAVGWFGGGDAKLMAAAGVWVGWDQLPYFIFSVVLTGGILSILVILLRRGLGVWPDWVVKSAEGLFTPNKAVPYGVAIAAGAMFTVPRMDVLPESWGTMVRFILG